MNTDVTRADLSDRVAEEIRSWMGRRRLSGAALARALGVSPAWVSYRLTGTQPIDLNDLQRIAAVLNVEAADLLPRDVEGRTVVVGGEPKRSTTVANHTPARRPQLTGHPKPFAPHDSTRRPVRLSPSGA
jgi:DNA-binding Xre family transcriptional regulator